MSISPSKEIITVVQKKISTFLADMRRTAILGAFYELIKFSIHACSPKSETVLPLLMIAKGAWLHIEMFTPIGFGLVRKGFFFVVFERKFFFDQFFNICPYIVFNDINHFRLPSFAGASRNGH